MSHNKDCSVERMTQEVYDEFAYRMRDRVTEHPICEECGQAPSVKINRWGTIKACCQTCLDAELNAFYDFCKEEEKREEEDSKYH